MKTDTLTTPPAEAAGSEIVRRTSVTQIAARAGVSIATVSRVLNNSRRVNPDIAEQVRQAVAELHYYPRPARRRNKANGAGGTAQRTIAVVSLGGPYRDWFEMPVMAAVVGEISRAAQQDRLGVLMSEMPDPHHVSPVLRQKQVEGALVFIHEPLDAASVLPLAQHLPVVRVMGGQVAPVEIDHVGPDNTAIGYLAAMHLMSQGCRRIGFVTAASGWELIRLRGQGFAIAAHRAGAEAQAFLVGDDSSLGKFFCTEAYMASTLEEVADELAKRLPDGLFVARDEEVVQVYRLLAERGIKPGRDVQVISCDNENVRLSMLHPRPATIEIGTREIARRAVRRLHARIQHPSEPPVRILVCPHLVLPENAENPMSAGRAGPA